MPVAVCPNGHRLQIQDAHVGRTINCPACQASFVATAHPGGSGEGPFPDVTGGAPPTGGVSVQKKSTFNMTNICNWFLGKPLLFLGLILVVFGKGCDTLSLRSVNSTQATYQLAKQAQAKKKEAPSDSQKKRLESLKESSDTAQISSHIWQFWYQVVFVAGTFFLMCGLLILAFTGQGGERWIAYIMIAIVTFSLYIGGAAWFEGLANLARR